MRKRTCRVTDFVLEVHEDMPSSSCRYLFVEFNVKTDKHNSCRYVLCIIVMCLFNLVYTKGDVCKIMSSFINVTGVATDAFVTRHRSRSAAIGYYLRNCTLRQFYKYEKKLYMYHKDITSKMSMGYLVQFLIMKVKYLPKLSISKVCLTRVGI